jgi:hypothetical protein
MEILPEVQALSLEIIGDEHLPALKWRSRVEAILFSV